MRFRSKLASIVLLALAFSVQGFSQVADSTVRPHNRVRAYVDDFDTISLRGNVRPEVQRAGSAGALQGQLPMQHMILHLKHGADQQAALVQLIDRQRDPKSPLYRKYLTPEEYGAQFGVSESDISRVTTWLTDHGFVIDSIPAGHRSIVFSGNANNVTAAFGTPIRRYVVDGAVHHANAEDPQIPSALAEVVGGIVKLHDFQHKPSITHEFPLSKSLGIGAQFNYGSSHYLSPADYSTIYNIGPLYSNQIDGTGQSIAIVARSNVSRSDVQTFRSQSGLPANDPTVIIAQGSDPGFVPGDGDEAMLDTEWAGAVAPKANIKVVVASSTNSSDGVDLSAQYIVNHNLAPVMSVSFGSCEAGMGSAGVAFYNALWQQAAAQGITVLVSSGDSGAAGCNGGGDSKGSMRGINGLCSSPYDVCVGGTQFSEGSNPGQYWLPGNNSVMGSAQGYIPEAIWNESGLNGGSGLWAGGGGASIYFTKPTWQSGPGVPADGARDVPDISLTAAGSHDGYLVQMYGGLYVIGGTSASSPSFAGLMALVNQKTGSRQGNPNPILYQMAAGQKTGAPPIFHDIISGNNSVPGLTGFLAAPGYDLASGLGSVDATNLVNAWGGSNTTPSPSLSVTISPATINLPAGGSGSFTGTVSGSNGFKSPVTLTASGAPAGMTVVLGVNSIASPGSGVVAATVTIAKTVAAGTYTLRVTAQGGNLTAQATTVLTVTSPKFTLSSTTSALTLKAGASGAVTISAASTGGFNSAITLTTAGLPAGLTASFSPPSINGSTGGSSTVNFVANSSAKPGTYPVTVTGTGGGLTSSVVLSITMTSPASFSLRGSISTVTLKAGGTYAMTVAAVAAGGFNSMIGLTASGLPAGLSVSFSPPNINGSTNGSSSVLFAASSTLKPATYPVTIAGTGGGLTNTLVIGVTVTVPANYTFTGSTAALTVNAGAVNSMSVTAASSGGFNSVIGFSASGLPAGIAASFSPASINGALGGSSTLNFIAASTVRPGVYPITLAASGGGLVKTLPVNVTVAAPASFTLTTSATTITTMQSGTGQVALTSIHSGSFNAAVTLSAALPNGLTASFSKTVLPAPGDGTATVTFSAASNLAPGTYTVPIYGTGAGLRQTANVYVQVKPASAFIVGTDGTFLNVQPGGPPAIIHISLTSIANGFNSPVSLLVAGSQSGINVKFGAATISPSSPSTTVTISAAPNASPGIFTIALAGTTNTASSTVLVSVTISNTSQAKH